MLDLGIDAVELKGLVEKALSTSCRLTPLHLRCTYPIYRCETGDGRKLFVKVGPVGEWERTRRLTDEIGDCELVPKLLVREPVRLGEWAVFIGEWRDVVSVRPEDMTDGQIDGFIAGCREFSAALQAARDYTPVVGSSLDPVSLYEMLVGYVRRHPLAGRLLKPLLEIPEAERTFGARRLFVVHGDFHSRNYGFSGDRLSSVFDFDKLTEGLACEDLVHAFVEEFACLGLSAAERGRLRTVLGRVASKCPWPKEELVISCNVLRLRIACRRIAKHPNAAWTAVDIWRRDRKIREFLWFSSRKCDMI